MSKDVIIAGAIAVGCVALIAVAVFGPKSKPAEEPTPVQVTTTETLPLDPLAQPFPGEAGSTSALTPGVPGVPVGPVDPFAPVQSQPFGSTPAPGMTTGPVAPPAFGTSPAPVGQPFGSTLPQMPPVVETTPVATVESKTHTVAAGELPGDIALKYYGSAKAWKKIAEANPGLDPKRLKIGQKLVIPAAEKSTAAPAVSAGPGERTYVIKSGDTYYTIAKRELGAASRWKEIEKLNNRGSHELRVGMTIKLPAAAGASSSSASTGAVEVAGQKTHTVAKGETLADISKKHYGTTRNWRKIVDANGGVSPENLKIGQKLVIPGLEGAAASVTTSAPVSGPDGEYVVQPGDTPRTIASKLLGSKNKAQIIIDANPGINPNNLRVGQKLKIPGAGAPAQAAPAFPSQPTPAFPSQGTPAFPNQPAPAFPNQPAPAFTPAGGGDASNPFSPTPAPADFASPYGPATGSTADPFAQPVVPAPAPAQPSPFGEPVR